MSLTSLAFVTGQFWIVGQSMLNPQPVYQREAIARFDDIAVGGSMVFGYPTRGPARAGAAGRGAVRSLRPEMHAPALPGIPESGGGRAHCPCHNGYFDIGDGRPIAGPAPAAAAPRRARDRERVIYATNVVLRTV
jgi:nitrite reductase/ring-hydroxylating ferredoxin subunit